MHDVHWSNVVIAIIVGVVAITIGSLIREPARQQIMAVILAGAGGVYFNGGLGIVEYPLSASMLACAIVGLWYYPAIGVGWLLHTLADILHHNIGRPLIELSPMSSAECAICDVVLAIWFFLKAPSVFGPKSGERKDKIS